MSTRFAGEMIRRRLADAVGDRTRVSCTKGFAAVGKGLSGSVNLARGGPTAASPAYSGGIYGSAVSKALGGCGIYGSAVSKALGGCGIYGSAVSKALGGGGIYGSAVSKALGGGGIYGSAVSKALGAGFVGPTHGIYGSRLSNVRGGGLRSTARYFSKNTRTGNRSRKDALRKMLKDFLDRKLAEVTWALRVVKNHGIEELDAAKQYLGRLWNCFWTHGTKWCIATKDYGSAWVKPVIEYLKGLWKRIVSLFCSDTVTDTGDLLPVTPTNCLALLKGIWEKVHAIDKTVHLPAAKTKFRELLGMFAGENIGDSIHKFLVSVDEYYSLLWKMFTFVCSASACIELNVTPLGAMSLFMVWLQGEMKKKLAEISELKKTEEKVDAGNTWDDSEGVGCKFCTKICSFFCSDFSTHVPSKAESGESVVCSRCSMSLDSPANADDKSKSDGSVGHISREGPQKS